MASAVAAAWKSASRVAASGWRSASRVACTVRGWVAVPVGTVETGQPIGLLLALTYTLEE